MSQAGWYPDPSGEPDRLRYFDGQQWTTHTVAAGPDRGGNRAGGAAGPAPQAGTGPQASRGSAAGGGRRGTLWAWILVGAVLVVGLAVVIGLVVRPGGPRDITNNPPPNNTTVTPWDDSSPTPTPTPTPSPTPSPTPTPSGTEGSTSPPPPPVECPQSSRQGERLSHPEGGRVHGGGLSFAAAPTPWYNRRPLLEQVMFFGYDIDGQALDVTDTWFSQMTVGALATEDGFREPKAAADAIISCVASSVFFRGFSGRKDLHSKEITVDGHQGWTIRTEVRVSGFDTIDGSILDVIVVDTGVDGALGFFVGETTIGHKDHYATRDKILSSLEVD